MTIAFVLGNGVSRLNIDPDELKLLGSIYACNACYRDFIPDYLIAVDSRMVIELIENNVQKLTEIWTNHSSRYIKFNGIKYFNPSKGWSSGPTALWLASAHKHSEIFILGFDYQGIENNTKFNNVYAGTKNYKKTHEPPTYYGNWLNQTEQVMKSFPDVKYYRVNNSNFVPDWKIPNIEHINYQEFKKMVKYQNCQF